jgi:hypothetical protein
MRHENGLPERECVYFLGSDSFSAGNQSKKQPENRSKGRVVDKKI